MPSELTINPWGLTGALAILMAWSLAVFLMKAAVKDRLTSLFAIVLLVEGAVLITASSGLVMLLNLEISGNYYLPHSAADCVMLAVYPLFLSYALPQNFLHKLRGRNAVVALGLFALAVFIVQLLIEFWLIAAVLAIMFTLAFVLAIHAVFLARTTLARRRALLFALAFGIRDLSWGFVYATGVLDLFQATPVESMIRSQVYVCSTLLYIPIVTYGILSVRLLNIQLQVRKGVRRGTLVGIFVAIFFLISEGSAYFLSAQFGTVAGLLGATLIVFLVSPLHRLAEWFSGQVVQVDEGQEYQSWRKLQMYAAAVEDALTFGEIGPASRSLLDRMRESLDIGPGDARRIEADLGLNLREQDVVQNA
jgi:hypothetical protein